MGVTVRNMEANDIGAVQQVAKSSWNATYKGIIPIYIQDRFLKSIYSIETLQRRLINSFLFVAETENKIVGFANFSPVNDDGETELGAIYLYPKYQGKGIGTALLNHGITKLKGIRKIYIHVEKNNQIGLMFYQAKGFIRGDEFKDYLFGHEVQTIRMSLNVES